MGIIKYQGRRLSERDIRLLEESREPMVYETDSANGKRVRKLASIGLMEIYFEPLQMLASTSNDGVSVLREVGGAVA